ncbi:hypothetical protein [Streptomyces sp. NPDC020965]|uniref:hypothetical protein n=1 Tax=Streptomyces sp. NPDC020965 TaxID=3365105 RepID=UPI00378ED6C7
MPGSDPTPRLTVEEISALTADVVDHLVRELTRRAPRSATAAPDRDPALRAPLPAPVIPTPRLTDDEVIALTADVVDHLVRKLTRRAPRSPLGASDRKSEARGEALASLRVLATLQNAVAHLEDHAARDAVAAGAGYPQLGKACNISRQGARRRWPGLVTSTSRPHPTDRTRSRP